MRKLSVSAAVLAGLVFLASCPSARAAVTKEQLDKAIEKLVASGEAWAAGGTPNAADQAELAKLKIDKDSGPVLLGALRSLKRDLNGAYATARLLELIQGSDKAVLDAVMPEVSQILLRTRGMYRPFPTISKVQADSLRLPDYSAKMSTDAIMSRMAALEALREAKKNRDMQVAKGNEAAWDIETAAYKIVALAGETTEDSKAMMAMAVAERAEDAIFAVIIDAYMAAMPKIDQARAAKLYSQVRPHALRLRMATRKNYIVKGKSVLQYESASDFVKMQEHPGIKVVTFINKLAEVAKDPKLQPLAPPAK